MNTLTVAGAEADFDSSRNSVSANISITAIADLSLKRIDFVGPRSEEPKLNDDEIVSVFTVGNNGPSDATNVVLTNELSVDVVLVSVIGEGVECRVIGGTVTCELSDLANAETLAVTNACVGCHSLDPEAKMTGPTWHNVGDTAVTRIEGMSPAAYLYNSIVAPNDYVVEGFPGNVMTPTFGDTLSTQELGDLIAYLLAQHGQ